MRGVMLGLAVALAGLLLVATPALAAPPAPGNCALTANFGPPESDTVAVTAGLDCRITPGTGFTIAILPFKAAESIKVSQNPGTGSKVQILQGTLANDTDFTVLAFHRDAAARPVRIDLTGLTLSLRQDKTATLSIAGPPGRDLHAQFEDIPMLKISEMNFDAESVKTEPEGRTGMEGILRVDTSKVDQLRVRVDAPREVDTTLFWLVGLALAIITFIAAYSSLNSGQHLVWKGVGSVGFIAFCGIVTYLVIGTGVAADADWVGLLAGIAGAPIGYGAKVLKLWRQQILTRRQTTQPKVTQQAETTAGSPDSDAAHE